MNIINSLSLSMERYTPKTHRKRPVILYRHIPHKNQRTHLTGICAGVRASRIPYSLFYKRKPKKPRAI